MGVYTRSNWVNNTDPALSELYLNNIENGVEMANAELNNSFWKTPVRAVSTAPVTLSGPQTVDQLLLAVGDRVLIKNQTDAKENGIYDVQSGPWTRSSDAAHGSQWPKFASVWCYNGMANYMSTWHLNISAGVTIGVTPLGFFRSFHDTVWYPWHAGPNMKPVPHNSGETVTELYRQISGGTVDIAPAPSNRLIVDLHVRSQFRFYVNMARTPRYRTSSTANFQTMPNYALRFQFWNSRLSTYDNVYPTTANDINISGVGPKTSGGWIDLPENTDLLRASRELRLMFVNGPPAGTAASNIEGEIGFAMAGFR